jgi:hypothetical protein
MISHSRRKSSHLVLTSRARLGFLLTYLPTHLLTAYPMIPHPVCRYPVIPYRVIP